MQRDRPESRSALPVFMMKKERGGLQQQAAEESAGI